MVFGDYHTVQDVPGNVQLISNYAVVFVGAILGCTLRLYTGMLFCNVIGITAPTSTDQVQAQSIVFYDLPANILGCFLMGLFTGSQHWLLTYFPAVFTGLTTGLCGTLTTFSGWMLQAALLCYNGNVVAGGVCILLGFCAGEGASAALG